MRWSPHVTVATVLEQNGKFLFVEEIIHGQYLINQPAGHWEQNETLIEASQRETQEETAWIYQPEAIVGIYQWQHPENLETFLRICFTGSPERHDPAQILDKGILRAVWLTENEVMQRASEHRSPLVAACLKDYLAGQRFDLSILKTY